MIFNAQTNNVAFSLTKNTFPYLPVPNYSIFSKSLRDNFFYTFFFNEADCFQF